MAINGVWSELHGCEHTWCTLLLFCDSFNYRPTVVVLSVTAVSMSSTNMKHSKPLNSSSLSKMKQWPQEQHKVTSPTTGQLRQHSAERAQMKETMDSLSSNSPQDNSAVPTMELYSLSSFLDSLLTQEKILWERNEFLVNSFRSEQTLLNNIYITRDMIIMLCILHNAPRGFFFVS